MNIKLNKEEQKLFDDIDWYPKSSNKENSEMISQLFKLLVKRKVIPKHRIEWFTEPIHNRGRKKSREDVFISNCGSLEEMLRHPDFIKYLLYFINGPCLDKSTIKGFLEIIENDEGTSGMVMDQLRAYTKKEIRDKYSHNSINICDEFYKLCLECGYKYANVIRDAARNVRIK